jgi:hypothetical protein
MTDGGPGDLPLRPLADRLLSEITNGAVALMHGSDGVVALMHGSALTSAITKTEPRRRARTPCRRILLCADQLPEQQSSQHGRVGDGAEVTGCDRSGNTCHPRARIGFRALPETTEKLVLDIGDRLVRLISSEIPIVVSNTVPTERRALQALVVKTVGIMRSLLELTRHGHNAEVMILARSLSDHVITFAWLAIDPEAHYPPWERGDARDRLAAQERWEKRGRTLLEPGVKKMFERQKANQVKYPPDMDDRADKADDYWATRLGFPANDKPFADTYDVIFKHCSSRTHASVQGLNDVLESTPEHTVLVLDRGFEYQGGVLRASLVIFGLGLKVTAEMFSIPASEKIDQLSAEYLRRRQAIDRLVSGSVSTGIYDPAL